MVRPDMNDHRNDSWTQTASAASLNWVSRWQRHGWNPGSCSPGGLPADLLKYWWGHTLVQRSPQSIHYWGHHHHVSCRASLQGPTPVQSQTSQIMPSLFTAAGSGSFTLDWQSEEFCFFFFQPPWLLDQDLLCFHRSVSLVGWAEEVFQSNCSLFKCLLMC